MATMANGRAGPDIDQCDLSLRYVLIQIWSFCAGPDHPVADCLLMCALKSLLLWIIAYSAKYPLSTGLELVRRYV